MRRAMAGRDPQLAVRPAALAPRIKEEHLPRAGLRQVALPHREAWRPGRVGLAPRIKEEHLPRAVVRQVALSHRAGLAPRIKEEHPPRAVVRQVALSPRAARQVGRVRCVG